MTAVIAMAKMDAAAKKTAISHLLFNVGGVVIALPLLLLFGGTLSEFDVDPAIMLANVHLVFNVGTSLIFLAFIRPFTRLVDLLMGGEKTDFERIPIPVYDEEVSYDIVGVDLRSKRNDLLAFLREAYSLVSLSIESGYRSLFEAASKRMEYISFLEKGYIEYFSRAVGSVANEEESRDLLAMNTQFDYLFQIYDSIDDIFNTKRNLDRNYIELKGDILLMVRGVSNHTLAVFDEINRSLEVGKLLNVREQANESRALLDEINRDLLKLLAQTDRRDAGALSNYVTYSRRLQDKLVNLAALIDVELVAPGTPDGEPDGESQPGR